MPGTRIADAATALARRPSAAIIAWLVTRLVMLALAWAFEWRTAVGDVEYYRTSLYAAGRVTPAAALLEYPTPVLWLLQLPGLVGQTSATYSLAFAALMVMIDLACLLALLPRLSDQPHLAWGWIAGTFLLGPLCYLRFDLVTSVLLVVTLLNVRLRPALAGSALALAAAIKLWPALVLLVVVGLAWPLLRRFLVGFVGTGLALVAASVAYAGMPRLTSPLVHQSGRGLNVDSIWATPAMIGRLARFDAFPVTVEFGAFQVAGPGVPAALLAATIATGLGLLVLCALAWRAWRDRIGDEESVAGLALVATLVLVLGNKALSPQYLLWLIPAVLFVTRPRAAAPWRLVGVLFAVSVALTHLTYPVLAGTYTPGPPGIKLTLATAVLSLRNLLLVVIGALAGWGVWRRLSSAGGGRVPRAAPKTRAR